MADILISESNLFPTRRDGQIGSILYGGGTGGSGSISSGGSTLGGIGTDNQVAVWAGSTTLEGTSGFTWDGTDQEVAGNGQYLGDVLVYSSGISVSWWDSIPVDNSTIHLNVDGNLEVIGGPSSMTWPATSGIAVYSGSNSWGTSITDNSTNWNTAYTWVNSYGYTDLVRTGDARLSNARTPVSHNNTYHSETYITSAALSGYAPLASPTFTGLMTLGGRIPGSPNIRGPVGTGDIIIDAYTDCGLLGLNYYCNRDVVLAYGGGNVGIGTTTPFNRLDVYGTASDPSLTPNSTAIVNFRSTDNTQLAITSSTTSPYGVSLQVKHSMIGNNYAYPLIFNPLGGNVGIGTTVPKAKTHIAIASSFPTLGTTGGVLFLSSTDTLWGTYFGGENATGKGWIQQMRNDSAQAYDLCLQPVGGWVGIGTTIPFSYLTINGSGYGLSFEASTNAASRRWWEVVNYSEHGDFVIMTESTKGRAIPDVPRLYISPTGNVGIGTISPVSILDVKAAVPIITINGTTSNDFRGLQFASSDTVTAQIRNNSNTGEVRFDSGMSAGWGGYYKWYQDTVLAMTLDSSNNLSVGGNGIFTGDIVCYG